MENEIEFEVSPIIRKCQCYRSLEFKAINKSKSNRWKNAESIIIVDHHSNHLSRLWYLHCN